MWAFFHRLWLAGLLAMLSYLLLPGLGPVLAGWILARRGDRLAWNRGGWESLAAFRQDMDIWDRYGIGLVLVVIMSVPGVVVAYLLLHWLVPFPW